MPHRHIAWRHINGGGVMGSDIPPGAPGGGAWNANTTPVAPMEPDATPTTPLASAPWERTTSSGLSGDYWQPPQPPPSVLPPSDLPPGTVALPSPPGKRGVSRRALLVGAGAGAAGVGALGAGIGLLLSEHGNAPSGSVSLASDEAGKVLHLLRRAGFGPSPIDLDDYLHLGVEGTIGRLLAFSTVPDDAVEKRIADLKLDPTTVDGLVRAWVLRMIYSLRPLQEKLTLFWHGVLTSGIEKTGGRQG